MKLVIIFGPPAVGKMTVGRALSEITDLKLFHNHLSIELVRNFFDFGHPQFRKLDTAIRYSVFREVAKSDLQGLIFTFVWAIDQPVDRDYINSIVQIFQEREASVHFVELIASQLVRLERNRGADRLAAKPSKRDLQRSEENLIISDKNYQLNTKEGDLLDLPILKIDNTHISPAEVALQIKQHYLL